MENKSTGTECERDTRGKTTEKKRERAEGSLLYYLYTTCFVRFSFVSAGLFATAQQKREKDSRVSSCNCLLALQLSVRIDLS